MEETANGATAELLRCAADHLDRVGLYKRSYFKEAHGEDIYMSNEAALLLGPRDYKDSPCCAYGALYVCATSVEAVETASREVAIFAETHRYRFDTLDGWNDEPRRRKSDVVKLFRKTAEDLEQG